MLGSKEHYELLEQFEKEFKYLRLDRERNKDLWRKGWIYQDGRTDELYGAYIRGYAFGKAAATPEGR